MFLPWGVCQTLKGLKHGGSREDGREREEVGVRWPWAQILSLWLICSVSPSTSVVRCSSGLLPCGSPAENTMSLLKQNGLTGVWDLDLEP